MNESLLWRVLQCWLLLVLLIAGCQPEQPRIPVVLGEIPLYPGHPVEVVSNPRTGYVYITNGYGDQVFVLSGLERVATLRTGGREANVLAVDEERGWVYVVNEGSDSVTVIQGTEVITTLEVAGDEPRDVAVEPASGWAYVVSGYRKDPPEGEKREVEGNVTVISGTETVGTIPLGRVLANRVVADPINGYIYVGNVGGEVIVIHRMEEITRLKAGSSINAMGVNSHTGDVYVTGSDLNLYQFRKTELVATTKVAEGNGSIRNMRVHPVTGDIFLVKWAKPSEIIVVRGSKVIARIPAGRGALKMAIDPLTGNVYVANFRDDTVTVVHGTEILATIDVGGIHTELG